MKLTSRLTNLGIEISLGTEVRPQRLTPAPDADQTNPRKNYVYAHLDSTGMIFYVGKGAGRRAWSTDRHPTWHRFVDKHLGGNYEVRILADNLSVREAEEIEANWIAQYADTLVNWVNMGRQFDLEALERYHKLRDANRALIRQGKEIEANDLAGAAEIYARAIEAIAGYALISLEKGLVGKLLDEETEEIGRSGEVEALDRLTICLVKLGRSGEAVEHVNRYFATYRRDVQSGAYTRILKRIEKALTPAKKGFVGTLPTAT